MDEKAKYEKVWRDCKRYGKNWMDRGLARKYKAWFTEEAPKQSTVIDFGCGNGTSLLWLKSAGYQPSGFDIASNAVTASGRSISIGDLRIVVDVEQLQPADFGLCTDLMEHIPTEDVDIVFENIAGKIGKGVLFGIARNEDKDGAALGLTLHLTRETREWWITAMLEHFSRVDELVYNDNAFICWAWK